MPVELLIKHFTSSYSASRAALLEAWKMFKMRRQFMASRFCQPIYEEWLTEAILIGRIQAPGFLENPLIRKAYAQAEWNGPSVYFMHLEGIKFGLTNRPKMLSNSVFIKISNLNNSAD